MIEKAKSHIKPFSTTLPNNIPKSEVKRLYKILRNYFFTVQSCTLKLCHACKCQHNLESAKCLSEILNDIFQFGKILQTLINMRHKLYDTTNEHAEIQATNNAEFMTFVKNKLSEADPESLPRA